LSQKPLSDEECKATLDAVAEHGSVTAAALALGINRATFASRVTTARGRQSPFIITGKSTLRNADGDVVAEWTKTSLDRQKAEEARQAAFDAMAEDLPRAAAVVAPRAFNGDLCNLYTFTDYHLGMLAQKEEGGSNWDLKIAEAVLTDSFAAMVAQSPSAETAVINLQGDLLHTDGMLPVTPAHGHILDADSRYSKIVKVAIRAIRRLVAMALAKHREVRLIIAEGNHDESGSIWLRQMFDALYENEPRITVDTSELPFYTFIWGETFLGFHHGHKVKNEQLPLLFAAQFRREWGITSKAYLHCGHRHHADEKEYSGATVIQHPTLAARDAYAARGGWIAERAAQSITYSKRFGQVGRVFVTPEMLAA
jgi:hypothetical protein